MIIIAHAHAHAIVNAKNFRCIPPLFFYSILGNGYKGLVNVIT